MTKIGDNPFWVCANLISINVDPSNHSYKSIDGVLFSKDGGILVKYPEGKEVEIYKVPDTVKELSWNAFNDAKIEKLFIGPSVSEVKPCSLSSEYIKEVYWNNEQPESIVRSKEFISPSEDAILYVPIGTGYAYRHHPEFKKFKTVKPINFSKLEL